MARSEGLGEGRPGAEAGGRWLEYSAQLGILLLDRGKQERMQYLMKMEGRTPTEPRAWQNANHLAKQNR